MPDRTITREKARKLSDLFSDKSRDTAVRAFVRRDRDVPTVSPEKKEAIAALSPDAKRFHGAKVSLRWFPPWLWRGRCGDRFGYMSSAATRRATRLPFTPEVQALLGRLGDFMADPARGSGEDSAIPAGYTYFGQFVDHDITLDIASELDREQDARAIPNMRSPSLDLDSLYGRGPALSTFLYRFPGPGEPPTAIRMALGTNRPFGPGGSGGAAGQAGMKVSVDADVPRMVNPLDASRSTNTAVIGDPRNDENLIVSQFHAAMLKFHNAVVDALVAGGFDGDLFAEAKRIVTHHYQWAVVHDFLKRVCGAPAVDAALAGVEAPVGSAFSMPVEFAVAAYRFGHSIIRERYWLNFNFPDEPLTKVFEFARNPRLPVFSNWVVDFNAFFDTGFPVPVDNKAAKMDSVVAPGLDALPGLSGMMAMLATRNLRRGLALGLPSGQGMAKQLGVPALTAAQLKQGLPAAEAALLDEQHGLLLKRTPLWYYVLREAAALRGGEALGPVGGRIVSETFVLMLKRDRDSFLRADGGFQPTLPAAATGSFTVADLLNVARVTAPA